ncbi:beta strand repeat-containing protein [Shewanella sp. MTB7]|uniref:beta strand repeat-containing protein n=2 Tax=unclassified Shewanella TaxID=196818 RepID=UPI0022BA5E8F|nr:hypothetical protein [Shewanella sp. MTB7]WBJ96103.1 hypothetical protein HWQ47_02935 [Shewanella sp. MTB7]
MDITEDTNDDGTITDAELDGQINIAVTLGSGTEIGDTVTITDQDNNVLYTGPVTQAMIDNDIALVIDAPANGTNLVITATVTDPAGNTATGSDSAILDYDDSVTVPAAPTVEIVEDTNDDGFINDTELSGQINITVALGANTVVGDTLIVTDQAGNELFNGVVTQAMIDDDLALMMDPPATGTNLVITATVTDTLGNEAAGSDNALLDYGSGTGAPAAPVVDITEDSNGDGYINDAELDGQINITVTLSAGTAVGDTLIVTDQDNNELFSGVVTQAMLDNGLDIAIDAPATGTNLVVTATVTDPAGNSATGTDAATLDYGTGAPAAPMIKIDEDSNDDGFINDAELDGQIDITVTLTAGTAVGDTLVVTDQNGVELFSGTVTQTMIDDGLAIAFDAPATGTNLVVTATVTDAAGNSASASDNATLDYGTGTGAPAAPLVEITEDANDDGYINDAELNGQIDATVTLGAGTAVGDTVTITDQDNIVIFSGPVTQEMIDDGINVTIDPPVTGTNLVITATVTDPAGNTSTGSDSATLDYGTGTGAPATPTVEIVEDINDDGTINDTELDGQIDITVTLGAGTVVGDTLVVTDQNNVELFSGVVTQAMLDNDLAVVMNTPPSGTDIVITATVTDVAGNTATGSDAATLDYVEAPAPIAPGVDITEDINDDGYINSDELDGQVNITITLDASTAVGDTLVVTDQSGVEIFNDVVTQAMLDNDLLLNINPPATGTDITITATITNANGDSAAGNDSATLDYGTGTGAPASPTVDITEDANDDGFINSAELDGQINITVTLGAGTAVGDTLIVTDQDNNVIFSGPVTQEMIDNDLALAIDAPTTGTNLVVTANVTDVAGNTATGADAATLDYGTGSGAPAAPQVEITEDLNDDGFINDAELDGQINATITLMPGTALGDTILIIDQDGNELHNETVTQDMLDNGINVSFDAPATGTNVVVTATVTDPAGNTATASDNALLDYGTGTGAPLSPAVDITEDSNDDGFINDVELSGQVDITVTLQAGTAIGDTLVVTDQAGNELFNGPVTQAMLDSGLSLAIDAPVTGTNLVITATVTDPAGNTATGSDAATLDYGIGSGAPASPTVTIDEDTNDDGFINDAELDGQINITIKLGEGTAVGDTLVVTDQGNNVIFTGPVTQAMLDNDLSLVMDAPATGTNLVITATVTDPAGNTATDNDNATLDYGSSVPLAPTVDITEDANGDGFINDAELDGQINIIVKLGEGTELGDTIVVTDQDNNVIFSGPVTQDMIDSDLQLAIDPPATGTNLVITATVTDPAGNSAAGTDSATLDYGVGTGAPAGPTVEIDEDTNDDGYINSAELDGQINITVTLGAGTAVGDTLIVTDQNSNVLFTGTVTQTMIDSGQAVLMDAPATGTNIVVTATVTDPAGNTATGNDAATLDYGVGTGAPAAPTVDITEDTNLDGTINDAELDGQIDITVTLGAGTAVGDTLVVTDQGNNVIFTGLVTQAMIDSGLSLAIDAPATGTTVVITATVTDPAGNTATGDDSVMLDYGTDAPGAPLVELTEDVNDDGFINEAELDGQINATITLTPGTALGDTILITDQDGNELVNETVTQDMLDNGINVSFDAPATGTNVIVTATVTDPAGNTATASDNATLDYGTGLPRRQWWILLKTPTMMAPSPMQSLMAKSTSLSL